MPASMTGFGAGDAAVAGVVARVELRSVNHRSLDPRFRLPHALAHLQAGLTEQLREALGRGHVDVHVELRRDADARPEVRVDIALATAWQQSLAELAEALGQVEAPGLELIVAQPGVMTVSRPEEDVEAGEQATTAAFAAALAQLQASRDAEGERLARDLEARLAALDTLRLEVAALAAQVLPEARDRLRHRVGELLGDATLDSARLETEIVLVADRSDVTEELVRLAGHLQACRATLDEPAPGRKLSFLSQELLREVNTIGSKSNTLAITERVVAAKVEIEKIREQVQNLA